MASAPTSPAPESRALLTVHRCVLVLLGLALAVGAAKIVTGELDALLPRLAGWRWVFPIAGWCASALSLYGLWRWRWWGYRLALVATAFELAVELYGGVPGAHLFRLPLAAALLSATCLPLRARFCSGQEPVGAGPSGPSRGAC